MSTAPLRATASRRAAGAAGALVSLVFLAAIVWWASRQEAPEIPTAGSDFAALGLAIVVYFAACAVRAERWQALLLENGARPRRADTYGLIAVGYLGNNVLPARAGDALRVMLLTPRARTDARTVIGTLVAERLCDVLVLGLLFVGLAYGLVRGAGIDAFGDRAGVALAVLAGVAVIVALLALVLRRTGHLVRLVDFARPMAAATRNLLRGRHGVEVLLLTLVIWSLEGAVWWLTAEAANLGVDVIEALYLVALSSMLVLVPAGPGYAGTLDAAVLIGAKALGRPSAAALTYLLLLRFVLMVPIAVAGLIVGATRYGGVRRVLSAQRVQPGAPR